MMRLLLTKRDGHINSTCPVEEVSDIIADPSGLVWLDVIAPSNDELKVLREEFGFHELALEDAIKRNQRPKIDAYDNFYLLVLYAVRFSEEKCAIDEHELDIFVGKNYIVTMHEGELVEVDEVAARWQRNAAELDSSVGVLLYSLIDTLIDDYLPVLDSISDHAERIEESIFGHFDPDAQQQIFTLRKELLNLRRVLVPERDVLLRLSRQEIKVLDERTEPYFQDVYDHIVRATDSVDLYRDLLGSALDSYLSLSSNNLNEVFRTLTSVSIILMTLSLIAGIYGMNFENMPELRNPYGYFITLGIMATVATSLYLFFHRKRWL